MNRYNKIIRKITYYYPFTVFGTVLFTCLILLFWDAFTTFNAYSFFLGFVTLISLAILVISGRVQAYLSRDLRFDWDSSAPLFACDHNAQQWVMVQGMKIWPLFQLHFLLRGRLRVCKKAYIGVVIENAAQSKKPVQQRIAVPLYFPLSGMLKARGVLVIKDIFGLTRTCLGSYHNRDICIKPALVPVMKIKDINALQGFEDATKKSTAEIEKYYMREYIPGDRLRDINWKATSRLSQLITKISPLTQEKTKTIYIFFRNYKTNARTSLESIVHLNWIKGKMLSFISQIMRDSTEYVFKVHTAEGVVTIESDEDLQNFTARLSAIYFQHTPMGLDFDHNLSEAFIFTTQYDKHLGSFITQLKQAKIEINSTAIANPGNQYSAYTFHLFKPFKPSLLPGLWALVRDRKNDGMPYYRSKETAYNKDHITVKWF